MPEKPEDPKGKGKEVELEPEKFEDLEYTDQSGESTKSETPPDNLEDVLDEILVLKEICFHCHLPTKHQCSRCKMEFFCSRECLRNGWKSHKATCNLVLNPPSVTLGNYSEPVVVLITFRKKHYFETVFRDLLDKLTARSKYIEATTPERLADILVEEKPTAILISDDTIMDEKYSRVRCKFMEFAKSGGTVLFCCWFAGTCDAEFMGYMFHHEWDLPWRKPQLTTKTFRLNPYRWTKLHGVDELPQKFKMTGYYLRWAMKEDAVYVTSRERRANQAWWVHDRGRSAVLFTPTGLGWVGYVGDDFVAPGLAQIICAMCGLSD